MQEQFQHFQKTLSEIIRNDFGDRQQTFCEKTGMEKSLVSKILNGRPPHHRHIQQIIPGLKPESGLALFGAWTKDVMGKEQYDRLFGNEGVSAATVELASYHQRNREAEEVLSFFRERYMEDKQFLSWLLQMGRMLEALPSEDLAKCAEEENPADAPEMKPTSYRGKRGKK